MKMKRIFPLAAALGTGALLLLRPETAAGAVREGLALCFRTVIPSLFPFFVVASLLLHLGLADYLQRACGPFMGPMFHLRGACALPLLSGLLGGYPSGARAAAELYGRGELTRQEAELLLGFCDNCGPAFILGYVGSGVLGSSRAGVWLFLVHAAAALAVGMVLCRLYPERGPALLRSNLPAKRLSFPEALTVAVSGAVGSTLQVCAFVALFQIFAAMMPARVPGAALGFLEMVSGVGALEPGRLGFISAAAVVGWGGLSVHCQAAAVAAGLSFRRHWLGKAMQAGLSALLAAAVWAALF